VNAITTYLSINVENFEKMLEDNTQKMQAMQVEYSNLERSNQLLNELLKEIAELTAGGQDGRKENVQGS
jgi:hypothetical protein